MCLPLGPRHYKLGRPAKDRPYPEYWMNEKRVEKEDGIYSHDGKTLVKLAPSVDGEYIIPETVSRVLVDAFKETNCKVIVFHPGIKTIISPSMFKGSRSLDYIVDQHGEKYRYNSIWDTLFLY